MISRDDIGRVADAASARWCDEGWEQAARGEYDGHDQDCITAAAEQVGIDLGETESVDVSEWKGNLDAVYDELTRRAIARLKGAIS